MEKHQNLILVLDGDYVNKGLNNKFRSSAQYIVVNYSFSPKISFKEKEKEKKTLK